MNRRGFTVTELLITVVIMGILLTLAVVNLRSSQARARDDQRHAQVEGIARHLEAYYSSHINNSTTVGYVGTANVGETELRRRLVDLDPALLRAPGNQNDESNFVAAINNNQTTTGVLPAPTTLQYVYQPLKTDGSLCVQDDTEECRRFTIFYKLEVATEDCPAPDNICRVGSQRQ